MKQLYFTIICVFAVLSLQAQAGPLVASDTSDKFGGSISNTIK